MNIENTMKWIEDLKTATTPQAQGALTRIQIDGQEADCCLGRLCKVLKIPRRRSGYIYFYGLYLDGSDTDLPDEAVVTLDLVERNPTLYYYNSSVWTRRVAADLNDEVGLSFARIADCIYNTLIAEHLFNRIPQFDVEPFPPVIWE